MVMKTHAKYMRQPRPSYAKAEEATHQDQSMPETADVLSPYGTWAPQRRPQENDDVTSHCRRARNIELGFSSGTLIRGGDPQRHPQEGMRHTQASSSLECAAFAQSLTRVTWGTKVTNPTRGEGRHRHHIKTREPPPSKHPQYQDHPPPHPLLST